MRSAIDIFRASGAKVVECRNISLEQFLELYPDPLDPSIEKEFDMNFSEVLVALQEGKFVKRSEWQDGFICLMPDMAYIWRVITKPQPNAGTYIPLLADLQADDWQTVSHRGIPLAPVAPPATPDAPPAA